MRIIAGQYGGRRLQAPKDQAIRPTGDKIRGAIFNALRSRGVLEDAIVLDLFCGTGALGLEALSQGASHCTFVDKSRTSLDLAKENAKTLGAGGQSTFLLKDAAKLTAPPEQPATLIFLDPPYGKDLITLTLETLHTQNHLAPNAVLVIETAKIEAPTLPTPYKPLDERTYGDTKIIFATY